MPDKLFSIFLLLILPAFVKAQVITDIKPTAGTIGSTITISGSGLAYKTLPTAVYFGTIPATVVSQSSTALSVTVPVGASYDRITVEVSPSGTAISEQFFLVQKGSPCAFKNPTFDAPVTVATAPNAPVFIELADMNSDGKEDLLVLSSDLKSSNALTIFSNISKPGAPAFEKTYETSLSAIPTSLAVGDLNIDGFMDIVIGYAAGNVITIIPGATGTTFSKPASITVGIKNIVIPRYIAINDLDADGIPDIITGNANANEGISILRKSTLSGFAYATAATAVTTAAVTSIDIGDLDLDGKKDILTAEKGICYFYSGVDGFAKPVALSSVSTNPILAGDYDQDGATDIVLGFDGLIGTYSKQNGNRQSDQAFSGTPLSMTGSDYNSDGNADLAAIFVNSKTGENTLAFYINDGSGGLQFEKQYIATGFKGKTSLAAGDVDQDGQADLVLSNPNKNEIYVYLKSSTVTIDAQSITATTPCQGNAATVTADINEGTVSWYADASGTTLLATGSPAQIDPKYLSASKNTIYFQGRSGKCSFAIQPQPLTVLTNPLPDATAFAKFPYLCQNDFSILLSVDASGKRTGSAYKYQWSSTTDIVSPTLDSTKVTPSDKTLITGTGSAGQFPAEKTTIYTYNLTVTNPNTLCAKTSSVAINVYSYAAAVTSSVNTICSGANVSFTASMTNGTFNSSSPFKWSNNYGLSNPADGTLTTSLNPVNTTTAASNLTFTITGQTFMGCPVTASKTITVNAPQVISPSSLPRTIINSGPYSQVFKTSSGTNPTFKIVQIKDPLPSPSEFSFSGNTFQGSPKTPYKGTFLITSTETGQCPGSAQYTFIVDDLADPNLIVFPMYKNVGDQPFFIQPITQSTGTITYSLKNTQDPNAGCVTIGPKGYVTITCAASKDSIPVIVKQDPTAKYKGVSIETFIKISPNKDTKVLLATSGVIAGGDTTALKYFTNSDADKSTIEFVQLNNTDIAEIKPDGTIIPGTQTGTVDVEIRIPATLNYAAVSRTFTITVYAAVQKPIVSTDTVVISVGQDTIINILENDLGVTRAIDPAQTDIDMENNGIQNKYYSLTMGNFLIDLNGNLQIKPFSGFIGEGKLGYTVTDSAGVKSEAGYVLIKVVPLTVTPPLKANEIMTPNSDGFNDGLVIAYANLTSNSLTIMDEAGNIVYETTNYQNDWTGINKKGKPVEAGVYYYVYKENDGRELMQYIQVVR